MHGRMIDGTLVRAPGSITDGGRVIYNPSAEILEAAGYLPVIETPYPAEWMDEDDTPQEMPHYAETWQERDGQIVRVWVQDEHKEGEKEETGEKTQLEELKARVAALEDAIANH